VKAGNAFRRGGELLSSRGELPAVEPAVTRREKFSRFRYKVEASYTGIRVHRGRPRMREIPHGETVDGGRRQPLIVRRKLRET
jgi:hypothetical protein